MIERSPVDITELALGILRNITITYGKDDPITGLSHSEMGEQRLMALLEGSVVSPSNAVALQVSPARLVELGGSALTFRFAGQGLWGLVNLAAANETAKLAIASRTQLLRSVVEHFVSTPASTLSSAQADPSPFPHRAPPSPKFALPASGASSTFATRTVRPPFDAVRGRFWTSARRSAWMRNCAE